MPKDTFLNLPEEKRKLIEKIAFTEFATYGYDNASINRMVATAQIAKGSFYQYFEDKKDLFFHLFDQASIAKMEFISPVLQNPMGSDFFVYFEALYISGFEFAKIYPHAAELSNMIYKNMAHPVIKELIQNGQKLAIDFFITLLKRGISDGNIRIDINIQFIAHMLISMNNSIFDYYFNVLKNEPVNMAKVDDELLETVKLALDFIKNGISLQNQGATNND